jgi:preprotein translocase subunit SecA
MEQQNFEIRKNVLKYDEVMNKQRTVIYDERRQVLDGKDLSDQIRPMITDVITSYVEGATSSGYPEEWDLEHLWTALKTLYPISLTIDEAIEQAGGEKADLTREFLVEELVADAQAAYDQREEELGAEVLRELERRVLLSVLDRKWREHLYEMDYLQEGIQLRAYAQRDPLVEYQREGYQLFQAMTEAIKEESIGYLFHVEVEVEEQPELGSDAPVLVAKGLVNAQRPVQLQYSAPSVDGDGGVEVHEENGSAPVVRASAGTAETDGAAPPSNRAARRSSKKRGRR